jgi:hypothetical protein
MSSKNCLPISSPALGRQFCENHGLMIRTDLSEIGSKTLAAFRSIQLKPFRRPLNRRRFFTQHQIDMFMDPGGAGAGSVRLRDNQLGNDRHGFVLDVGEETGTPGRRLTQREFLADVGVHLSAHGIGARSPQDQARAADGDCLKSFSALHGQTSSELSYRRQEDKVGPDPSPPYPAPAGHSWQP